MTPTDEYINFGIYMWDISSFNKVIKGWSPMLCYFIYA
jgi:hypothetical protein